MKDPNPKIDWETLVGLGEYSDDREEVLDFLVRVAEAIGREDLGRSIHWRKPAA